MLITYFRSSSYNQWNLCQQSYFLTYVLGMQSGSGLKAEKGTIVHKVMECLAASKLCKQRSKLSFVDDSLGEIQVPEDLFDVEFVSRLTLMAYEHYATRSVNGFVQRDFVDCQKWVWKVLDERIFDPRRLDIVSPEGHFDLVIDEPWAKYDYTLSCGKRVCGTLAIKGTIDLITRVRNDFYEIVDWKTGKRIDWATGAEKDFCKLSIDPQLRIYHYALSRLYPSVKYVAITIHFINDGGPFTLSYGPDDLIETTKMIQARMKQIQRTTRPILKGHGQHWFCNRVCHFGKNTMPGENRSICKFIHDETVKHGIEYVMEKYTANGFDIGFYQNPGE